MPLLPFLTGAKNAKATRIPNNVRHLRSGRPKGGRIRSREMLLPLKNKKILEGKGKGEGKESGEDECPQIALQ